MRRAAETGAPTLCAACWDEADEVRRDRPRYAAEMAAALPPDYCEGCEKAHALLPENERAFGVFAASITQRIVGPEGTVHGLRYDAVWRLIDEERVEDDERLDVFRKVRLMESEALEYWREERERALRDAERRRPQRN